MPLETVPGTELSYCLIAYDENGKERAETIGGAERLLSDVVVERLKSQPVTDVFIMSHGWKGDVPSAQDQYRRWIRAVASAQRKPICERFLPLIVGVHWPSLPWGNEELAGAAAFSFAATAEAGAGDWLDILVERYARRIADTPRTRAALRTIFTAAAAEIAPAHLSEDVREAYKTLNAEAGLGSEGPAAGPGADREGFDADRAYQFARTAPVSFGGIGVAGILEPLRQLTFWKMKDRGRQVGESGAHQLLTRIEKKSQARLHLMGHSFGCIVVSAMLAGPGGHGILPRAVNSLMLVQGAFSLWSYCADIPVARGKAGYFRSVIADQRVRGPIVTTQSIHDTAVGTFYPLAAGVALQLAYAVDEFPRYGAVGAFGIRGIDERTIGTAMLPADGDYKFKRGWICNLDGSAFICEGHGPSGAHSDIAKPEVAHALWEAARASVD